MENSNFIVEHMDLLDPMSIILKIEAEDILDGNKEGVIHLLQKDKKLFLRTMSKKIIIKKCTKQI